MDKEEIKKEIIRIEKKIEDLKNKLENTEITENDIFPGSVFISESQYDNVLKGFYDIKILHHVVIVQCEYKSEDLFSIAGLYNSLQNYSNEQSKTKKEIVEYLNHENYKCVNDLFSYRLTRNE